MLEEVAGRLVYAANNGILDAMQCGISPGISRPSEALAFILMIDTRKNFSPRKQAIAGRLRLIQPKSKRVITLAAAVLAEFHGLNFQKISWMACCGVCQGKAVV
jgi:hypothetical protein